jgi:CDP-paratose 2-epimerase
VLEAIALCEEIAGRRLAWEYDDAPRVGDHIWWISDTSKFSRDYPGWTRTYDLRRIVEDVVESHSVRWV